MQPISIVNAGHYTWGDACDGWHLVQSPDLSVIQERVPAGNGEVTHFHRRARQFFYILDGEGTIVLDRQEITIQKGSGLEIPPGLPHRFCNRSAREVTFLVVSTPPSHGDRVDV